ncbi:hypothetical protein [Halosegnis marinus]|uniref:Transporter n=1 Tax=Halosegnis marinus TaxID=3034023 RepID=A0ABD5ZKY1_9EURY|nr:hypothetical protein [Halosegnis sp. DT85]
MVELAEPSTLQVVAGTATGALVVALGRVFVVGAADPLLLGGLLLVAVLVVLFFVVLLPALFG